MKILRYATVAGVLALSFLLYAAPSFINWNNKYKSYIEQKLKETYGTQVNINGSVEVSFIPIKMIIHDLYIKHESESYLSSKSTIIEKLEFKPSFLSLVKFAPSPKKVTIHGLITDIQNLYKVTKTGNNIKSVSIINSDVNVGKKDKIRIKTAIFKGTKANRKITSTFILRQNNYNLNASMDLVKHNTYQVDAKISSNFLNIALVGKQDQNAFKGKLTAKANNLLSVISGTEAGKQTADRAFELTSDIHVNNDELKIYNLRFNSEVIKGNGEVAYNRNNTYNVGIKLEKIDIDYLFFNQREVNHDRLNSILENFRLIIPDYINANSIIKAQEVKYNGKILSNIELKTGVHNGKADINLTLVLPGSDNSMGVTGEISSNKVISSFKGILSAQGQDMDSLSEWLFPISIKDDLKNENNKFKFSGYLYVAPRIFMISNVKMLMDEGNLHGEVSIKYNKKINIIDGKIDVNDINLNKYSLNFPTEIEKGKLPMQWLRDTKFDIKFKTSINNLILKNNQVKKISFLVNTIKDNLSISDINLIGDNVDISGNVQIITDFKTIKPTLKINLSGKEFSSAFIEFPNLIIKTKALKTRNETMKIIWSHYDFDFFKLNEFNGNINIDIKEFKTKSNILKDFKLNTILKDGLISVKLFEYKVAGGYAVFQGNIGTGSQPSLVSSFSIANLDISYIAKLLDIDNFTGNISISGSVKTEGKSVYEWVSKAVGKVSIAARGINFVGVDLDSFIVNLLKSKSKSDIASLTQVSLYSGNTSFTTIDGSAKIQNGICSTSLQFMINNASGSVSSNISLLQFTTISCLRLFFIPPEKSNPVYIDLNLTGPIWQPKVNFNIDDLYSIIKNNN
ncbi:AsmA-like C-terminal region-containing protein [Candidatus Mesenet endosymbiont of Agriotes lineatus]|uniref:AsmA family protein n=1 Tax=Candidatus Mesenet endosymbiont of Agriotes lineatus TaxID=3077948 RepID=UPI0030D4D5C6